jgi:Transposase DDE domain
MDWQKQLISLYLFVCKHYESKLSGYCERMTNYADLSFSDEEVITIYLHSIMEGYHSIQSMHRYVQRHLRDWFPKLPGYGAFVQRINQIYDVFTPLTELLSSELTAALQTESFTGLTDAMPIIMAHRSRRFRAKVAPEMATKNGYCATKKLYYYGVKLHVVACRDPGALPKPICIGLTDAGMHDRKAFEQIMPFLPQPMKQCFADKAYQVANKSIHTTGHTTLLTPVKKQKGQKYLDSADQLLSTTISRIRQPIESLFNWIHEKTGIQLASKVRSYQGLMVHVFGRLAAALFMMRSAQIGWL